MLSLRCTRQFLCIGNSQVVLRSLSHGGSVPHAGAQGSSNFFSLVGLAGVGCVVYAYYDPDILPTSVKKWLSIQEPEGRSMTSEEYERWRAKQAEFPVAIEQGKLGKEEVELKFTEEEKNVEAPTTYDNLPIPLEDVSLLDMKASLEKLLAEARENEAAFIADVKSNSVAMSQEDRQTLQAFKDEKARLKKQLKFLKSNNIN